MTQPTDPVPAEAARLHDLQQRIEAAITAWDADVPGTEGQPLHQAVAVAVLPRLAIEREIGRIDGLGEGADIAEQLPTPDNCREMSSFSGAWDSGTYAVAAALRARANEIDQQPAVLAGAESGEQR